MELDKIIGVSGFPARSFPMHLAKNCYFHFLPPFRDKLFGAAVAPAAPLMNPSSKFIIVGLVLVVKTLHKHLKSDFQVLFKQ